jgi:hypothetical protein
MKNFAKPPRVNRRLMVSMFQQEQTTFLLSIMKWKTKRENVCVWSWESTAVNDSYSKDNCTDRWNHNSPHKQPWKMNDQWNCAV